MKLNEDKYHLLPLAMVIWQYEQKIIETKIWKSKKQNVLRIVTDVNLTFDENVFSLCKKGQPQSLYES